MKVCNDKIGPASLWILTILFSFTLSSLEANPSFESSGSNPFAYQVHPTTKKIINKTWYIPPLSFQGETLIIRRSSFLGTNSWTGIRALITLLNSPLPTIKLTAFEKATAYIDLVRDLEYHSITERNKILAPIVFTLTEMKGVKKVSFSINGKPLGEFSRKDFFDQNIRFFIDAEAPLIHTVIRGETIYNISQFYQTPSHCNLCYSNALYANITPGQEILISHDYYYIHKVEKRETLFSLHQRYGVAIEKIKAINQLQSNVISEHQELALILNRSPNCCLPEKQSMTSTLATTEDHPESYYLEDFTKKESTSVVVETVSNDSDYQAKGSEYLIHKVKKQETLFSLSRQYETSVQRLKEINQLKSNTIQEHQELIVRLDKNHLLAEVDDSFAHRGVSDTKSAPPEAFSLSSEDYEKIIHRTHSGSQTSVKDFSPSSKITHEFTSTSIVEPSTTSLPKPSLNFPIQAYFNDCETFKDVHCKIIDVISKISDSYHTIDTVSEGGFLVVTSLEKSDIERILKELESPKKEEEEEQIRKTVSSAGAIPGNWDKWYPESFDKIRILTKKMLAEGIKFAQEFGVSVWEKTKAILTKNKNTYICFVFSATEEAMIPIEGIPTYDYLNKMFPEVKNENLSHSIASMPFSQGQHSARVLMYICEATNVEARSFQEQKEIDQKFKDAWNTYIFQCLENSSCPTSGQI